MATKKKMLQAAAGNAGGAGLDVEEVFSTYLYAGTGANQTITNGIDLAGEGGLVWLKERTSVGSLGWHSLYNTERGVSKYLSSNNTNAEASSSGVTAFNSNGFTLGSTNLVNQNTGDFASWTFRKAPKFFDLVTYTGGSSQPGVYSHGLKSTPGMIIFKKTSGAEDWWVWHRSAGGIGYAGNLNTTGSFFNAGTVVTAVSDTTFSVNYTVNGNGDSYVAYLFAHNDGDGGFGPTGDQDIIKCGTYEGNGGTQEIDLGFEPQWVMIKNIESRSYQATLDWNIFDNMRGWVNRTSGDNDVLTANESDAEIALARCFPTANGFAFYNDGAYSLNVSGDTYIYMAIRRGTKVPESADEVFDVYAGSDAYPTVITTGFTVDSLLGALRSGNSNNFISGSRLTGSKSLITSSTAAEGNGLFSGSTNACFMRNDGILPSTFGSSNTVYYSWKRAPGFFDVVAYTGDGTSSRAISHNLGVEPELIISKRRSGTRSWFTQAPGPLGYASLLYLDTSDAAATNGVQYGMSTADAETFTTGTSHSFVNSSGDTFITYLFASLDGISKVGSYTGNGESVVQTIDCGFTSSARFVLIKKSSSTGNWIVYDVERGITTATSDGVLLLNSTNAESPESLFFAGNAMQPDSSGFKVTTDDLNRSGDTYIFYAIA